jgi:DNA-binding MarR family transcriptional regulator
MHIDKSNVARGLMNLSELGYISRIQDTKDMRCILLYPTQTGIDLAIRVGEIFKKQRDFILQDFDEVEQLKLMDYLEKLKVRAAELLELEKQL